MGFWLPSSEENNNNKICALDKSPTKVLIFAVLETDRPDPALTQAEIKYVPEQM